MGVSAAGTCRRRSCGEGHDRYHRGSAGAYPAWCARLKAEPAGELAADRAVPGRRRVGDPDAGGIESRWPGASLLRCGPGAAARATAPPGQPQSPCPWRSGRPGATSHPERSARSARAQSPPLSGNTKAPEGANQQARDALSGTRRARQGVDQDMRHLRLLQRLQRRHHCR
jgi:hypothetical protein